MFTQDQLSHDAFLCGRVHLWQPIKGYRAATDPVLLAAACPAQPGQTVLDLGCGAGAAMLCLAARVPALALAGLEPQPGYADLARRNAAANGFAADIECGDLAEMPQALRRGFDHVIANPPYYPQGGTPSPLNIRDTALRREIPLGDWVQAAARRLNPGGWLTLICGADGLPEVLGALAPRVGSAAVLPLARPARAVPPRILLHARKGGRERLLAPFVLHQGPAHDGDRESYTPAASEVLRGGAPLSAQFG